MVEVSKKITFLDDLGFPNNAISTDGTVYSMHRGRCIKKKQWISNRGYPYTDLVYKGYRKHYLIHRLLALTYIPRIPGKDVVDHIDGNTMNYSLDNLHWVTQAENMRECYGFEERFRKNKEYQSYPVYQIHPQTCEILAEFPSGKEAWRVTGIWDVQIARCCRGIDDAAGGYIWRKVEGFDPTILKPYRHGKLKRVHKFGLDGKYICSYGSIMEAMDMSGLKKANIGSACNGTIKSSAGFQWRLAAALDEIPEDIEPLLDPDKHNYNKYRKRK